MQSLFKQICCWFLLSLVCYLSHLPTRSGSVFKGHRIQTCMLRPIFLQASIWELIMNSSFKQNFQKEITYHFFLIHYIGKLQWCCPHYSYLSWYSFFLLSFAFHKPKIWHFNPNCSRTIFSKYLQKNDYCLKIIPVKSFCMCLAPHMWVTVQ